MVETTADIIYIFHGETASPDVYDNRLWAEILGCPMGDAQTQRGEKLFDLHLSGIRTVFEQLGTVPQSAVAFTKQAMCPHGPFSLNVQCADGVARNIRDFGVIIIACHWIYHEFIQWVRKICPSATLIGIHDDSLQEMLYCDPSLHATIIRSLSCLDGYISYTKQMADWVRVLVPKVQYWHHPITEEFLTRLRSQTLPKVDAVCLGVSNWNYDLANFITSISIFKRLRQEQPNLTGDFLGIREYRAPLMEAYHQCCDGLNVVPWQTSEYYAMLSGYQLVLQMNSRAVAGRLSAEAAAVGTPVVGNIVCDMQEYCWPELSISEFNACEALTLAKRLLEDHAWREKIVNAAQEKISGLAKETELYKIRFAEYVDCIRLR